MTRKRQRLQRTEEQRHDIEIFRVDAIQQYTTQHYDAITITVTHSCQTAVAAKLRKGVMAICAFP